MTARAMGRRPVGGRARTGRVLLALLAVLALLATAAGCGGDDGGGAATPGGVMEVTGAFLPEPPATVAAIYFTVTNRTGRDDAIVGIDTTVASSVELHESVIADGQVTMGARDRVEVAEGASVVFEPGALHAMLIDVQPVREGDRIQATFRFEHADPVTVEVPVAAIGASSPP